ncbi:MAG: TonB-dependent receptor, partial [Sphingobacteriales bacterium]
MLLKFDFFVAAFIIANSICVAQNSSVITGRVINTGASPLPMASVILLKDTSFVAATISNEEGLFLFNSTLQENAAYIIQVSLVGFQTFRQSFIFPDTLPLKKIILLPQKNILKEVTIVSQKQLVTRKADRYVINVENSYLANGGNGMDVLQKSPGLWVNTDGSIRLKGNQPVMVMINDIVQRMAPDELAEYLNSLPSESISKIEVIQNPPAEYEAAGTGGIVHIILKKARKDGLNAAANNTYRIQGHQYLWSSSATVDYKIKRLYLSANGSLSKDRNDSKAYTNIIYPDKTIYNTNGTRDNDNRRQLYRFTAGYDVAPGHFIGLQHVRVANQFLNTFNTSSFYKDSSNEIKGDAFTNWQRKPAFTTSTLNYSWKTDSLGSQLKIIADRTQGKKYEMNALKALYDEPSQNLDYRIFTPITTNIYTLQADFLKVMNNNLQWSTGIKFTATGKDNQFIREDKTGAAWIK